MPITAGGHPKKADTLNAELAKKTVYDELEQKSVTAWLGLRNDAAHGSYDEYDATQVRLMVDNVRAFLSRFPASDSSGPRGWPTPRRRPAEPRTCQVRFADSLRALRVTSTRTGGTPQLRRPAISALNKQRRLERSAEQGHRQRQDESVVHGAR